MSKPLILIDSNYVSHYVRHANAWMSWKEKETGVIFGFMKELLILARKLRSNRFAFAWDSRQSIRKQKMKIYKKRKELTEEEVKELLLAFQQFVELRTYVLPKFGFGNVFIQNGYEADDIIASICMDNPKTEIVIVSADNDLYQLLSGNHSMMGLKDKELYTAAYFREDYGINPSQWIDVKSIAGCSGDGIPGVSGVGNTKAIQYLTGEMNEKTQTWKKINDSKKLIEETRWFVELPLEGVSEFEIKQDKQFLADDFLDICEEFGFRSFLKDQDRWIKTFGMIDEIPF